jgi:putative flippase GtrA
MTLRFQDLFFAAINGAFVGLLAPFIFKNLNTQLPLPYGWFVFVLALLATLGVAAGYWIAANIDRLRFTFQLAKFGLIGVTNTIIDLGVFNLFIYLTDIATGNSVLIFKFFSVNAAIVNSYIWNKYWSFEKKDEQPSEAKHKEVIQFWIVSIIGLILNAGITWLMINALGAPGNLTDKAWASVASASASILVLTWNFLGYKLWVFKR